MTVENGLASPWWSAARHADIRPFLTARSAVTRAIRAWFEEQGFTEVETSVLQISPGNETHLHAPRTELTRSDGQRVTRYLRTSPEFACKKLLAAGEERIFELARVFREHPSAELPGEYAEAVSRLGFVPLRGFLRGYIDLVLVHDERYFLVDYKANHLGDYASDYAPEGLARAMLRGQYFLQYHLYALALHRYLGQRLRGYDFERHFGGVYYLFIKGMGPELGQSGVFYEKPPLARLDALSRLLEQAT
jgi:ATP-dependent exoDNAse (exonuclease V) beta subunit